MGNSKVSQYEQVLKLVWCGLSLLLGCRTELRKDDYPPLSEEAEVMAKELSVQLQRLGVL